MGLGMFSSGSDSYNSNSNTSPNPNKYRFKINSITEGTHYDLIQVNYPDCTTFNGDKVLVVKKGSVGKIKTKELDPHFFEDGNVVARFKPTEDGIQLGLMLINL